MSQQTVFTWNKCFSWTVVLKVRCPSNPTVLCIIWTCMHPWVTTSVPVLKTTRLSYSNRRCCHIRVFHLIWQPDHLRSLSYGTIWEATLVTHYRPSIAASWGNDRTLMNHLLPYGTHVSSPFWSTWFIIHLCSSQGWTVINRKVPASIPQLPVQVWFDLVQRHSVRRSRDCFHQIQLC